MVTILLKREFDEPMSEQDIRTMAMDPANCMDIYQVKWLGTHLSNDGTRLLCLFHAPDAESVRGMLNATRSTYKQLATCSIHSSDSALEANVMVERYFEQPADIEALQKLEDDKSRCLESRNVTFVRTLLPKDRLSMFCLYNAADAESVRQAQMYAGMPFEQVWPCQYIQP
jgi:hypothetical protein